MIMRTWVGIYLKYLKSIIAFLLFGFEVKYDLSVLLCNRDKVPC